MTKQPEKPQTEADYLAEKAELKSSEEMDAAQREREYNEWEGKLTPGEPHTRRVSCKHPNTAQIPRVTAVDIALSVDQPTEPLLQFFHHSHLPPNFGHSLATVNMMFKALADQIVATMPRNPERTVALRKLVEAKDCVVRAETYNQHRA